MGRLPGRKGLDFLRASPSKSKMTTIKSCVERWHRIGDFKVDLFQCLPAQLPVMYDYNNHVGHVTLEAHESGLHAVAMLHVIDEFSVIAEFRDGSFDYGYSNNNDGSINLELVSLKPKK